MPLVWLLLVLGAKHKPSAADAAALDEAAAQLDAIERSARETIQERERQCLAAFGHRAFCGCLTSWLPWQVDFPAYVSTTAATDADIDAHVADENVRKTLHRARVVRDYCVALIDGSMTQTEYEEDLRGAEADVAEGRKLDRVEIRLKLLRRPR